MRKVAKVFGLLLAPFVIVPLAAFVIFVYLFAFALLFALLKAM